MSTKPNFAYEYQVGRSLPFDAPSYVVRQADGDLYKALKAGKFCYVLNSRQTGKSSLRVKTMYKLQAEEIACACIDLNAIGSQEITPQQWYGGMIAELVDSFQLKVDRRSWLREHDDLSPVQRLGKFIEKVLLVEISENIVIFVDEIDSILNLSFPTEEFFALIQDCYEKRANQQKYGRITFVLLGAATPYDLIKNKSCTPFNICQKIELSSFKLNEAQPLVQGLVGKISNPQIVLQEVFYWTGGQPFLTQKLCQMIVTSSDYIPAGGEAQWVKQLVRTRLIENWEFQDEPEHLRTIRDRIMIKCRSSEKLQKLYRKILTWGKIKADDSSEYLELQLSGLIVNQQGYLRVYNRIYQSVFDQSWVAEKIGLSPPKPPVKILFQTSLVISAFVMVLRWLGIIQPIELGAFDKFMQLRPYEKPDPRLLIVELTKDDIRQLNGEYPLQDKTIVRLLKKLDEHQPQVIGLDIYRDEPIGKGQAELVNYLKQNKHIVPVCIVPSAAIPDGVASPPGIPENRAGFGDVVVDTDGIVRRHLLAFKPPEQSPCPAFYSLSFQLAFRYLNARKITLNFKDPQHWILGNYDLKSLTYNTGFYQKKVDPKGFQLFLNYRSQKYLKNIAKTIPVTDVLNNRVNSDLIKGKIILIGVTDPRVKDEFNTPFNQEIRGVVLHTQMVSQILSAVENSRPLLWFLPQWGDFLCILGCSVVGGILGGVFAWRSHSLQRLQLSNRAALVVLGGTCCVFVLGGICYFFLLTTGILLPFIPSVLALATTGASLVIYTTSQNQRLL
ncbi:MAG TPA: hypothetical protein DDW76_09640 [Cyanobacteria bacterium UBA11369]|nr:hypothetical protein [Cyanobacteria bacterium UBA11371]HBE34981.1 hypothetical protein [Cyanobacteria bacterium UBA11368]HBE49037.1 hypothetical protein [Cyanobacteria bacterium UBA11369]